MTTAEKCKFIRYKLGISQFRMAELTQTTQTNISFIERGFTPPMGDAAYPATVSINTLYERMMK